MSESSVKDAIRVMLDVDDVSSTSPCLGTFNIQFDAGGNIQIQRGSNRSWVTMSPEGIEYAVEIAENRYYQIEAAIPWSLLGKQTPSLDQRMAIGVELLNVHASGYILETIPDMQRNVPASWIETRLSTESVLSVGNVRKQDSAIVLTHKGNHVDVSSDELIRKYKLYSINGRLIGSREVHSKSFSFQPLNDISILVVYHSGNMVYSKVIVKPV